mmetsp:Transcript_50987/g.157815  ORF Transcript_50987/g.157815 Transcript_50987/m.157815 type:complete len:536 (-) Transcript_50987:96-1703(-)
MPTGLKDTLSLVEEALSSERAALSLMMEQRHQALLAQLEEQLQSLEASGSTREVPVGNPREGARPSTGSGPRLKCSPVVAPVTAPQDLPEPGEEENPEEITLSVPTREGSPITPTKSKLRSQISHHAFQDDRHACLRVSERLARNSWFEAAVGISITVNLLVMACEAQYKGIESGYKIGFATFYNSAEDAWPYVGRVFDVLEIVFGTVYTLELIIKVFGLRLSFARSLWNWFDLSIVIFWFITVLGGLELVFNPMLLRVARLVKLLRVVRVFKTMQVFDVLHLMIGSLKASLWVSFWSFMVLGFIMGGCALTLNYLLEPYVLDTSEHISDRIAVYTYFGTFSRSFLSMFELTLGNWIPITRTLHEKVTEWFCPIILLYQSVVVFAVIKVITGIFLHETFKVAGSDDDLMIAQKARQMRKHVQKMKLLMAEADESNDGYLSNDEFIAIAQDARAKTWLAAMELEVRDAQLIYDLIDDGDNRVSAEELVKGIGRLKGNARSLDMITLMRQVSEMQDEMKSLKDSTKSGPSTVFCSTV